MSYYNKSDLENILGCPAEEIQQVLNDEPTRPPTRDQEFVGCLLLVLCLGILFLCVVTDMFL